MSQQLHVISELELDRIAEGQLKSDWSCLHCEDGCRTEVIVLLWKQGQRLLTHYWRASAQLSKKNEKFAI